MAGLTYTHFAEGWKCYKQRVATKKLQENLADCNLFVTFASAIKPKEIFQIMKTSQLTKLLKAAGCSIVRHGGNHDIWYSPITGLQRPVPRHGSQEVHTGLQKTLEKDLLGL